MRYAFFGNEQINTEQSLALYDFVRPLLRRKKKVIASQDTSMNYKRNTYETMDVGGVEASRMIDCAIQRFKANPNVTFVASVLYVYSKRNGYEVDASRCIVRFYSSCSTPPADENSVRYFSTNIMFKLNIRADELAARFEKSQLQSSVEHALQASATNACETPKKHAIRRL